MLADEPVMVWSRLDRAYAAYRMLASPCGPQK